MTDAWAAIVAAIAAGVFGIGGTFAGIYVGRRGVTDQAVVEHGQWLRGQRQEAYLLLLDAWDAAVRDAKGIVETWDERERWMDDHGETENFHQAIAMAVDAIETPLRKPLERAHLLGPEAVENAVEDMANHVEELREYLDQQADASYPFDRQWARWPVLETAGQRCRMKLVAAAKGALRPSPTPGG
ncbi:hypothetical protein [Streptomyces olivochromogenes]|nr:hypothetical protein [Streptomyces olivochromogenes]KUN38275.1 hypothetical protein AQJ27_45065 [Streptomyces olivochromogenes]